MKGDFMKEYWKNRQARPDGRMETMKEYRERTKPTEVKNDGIPT